TSSQRERFQQTKTESSAKEDQLPIDPAQFDALVNKRVEQELHRLFAEHPELSRAGSDPHRALLDAAKPGSSTAQAAGHHSTEAIAQDLRSSIEKYNGGVTSVKVPESVTRAQKEVVECYRDHQGRPLDCWAQVEAFKNSVRQTQTDHWKEAL
ncbi:hypothetical protein IWQ60_010581, partial [Tieghemiomyces parasiticus]